MFGVSLAELIVVMVVALLVFGPEKLPEIASQIGELSFKLKRASDSFRREFYNSVYTPTIDSESSNTLTAQSQSPSVQDPTAQTECSSAPAIPASGLPNLYSKNESEAQEATANSEDIQTKKKASD